MNNNIPNNLNNNGINSNIPNNPNNNGINNNIPGNFNNGMTSTGSNNFNNPIASEANRQMAGGQSQIGNGPNVIQGIPNVQNERGIAQGMSEVQNNSGIMQGNNMTNQNMQAKAQMPGQTNSGINSYTMQKEEPTKTNPKVVSIPSFGEPVQNQNMPNYPQNPIPNPGMQNPNSIGQMPNQNIQNEVKIPNMDNFQNQINNIPNPNNIPNNNNYNPNNNNNNLGQSIKPNNQQVNNLNNIEATNTNNQIATQMNNRNNPNPAEPQKSQIMGIPSNNKPLENQNNSNIQKDIKQSNKIPTTNPNIISEIGNTRDLNNAIGGIKPTNTNSGISQVGQTEINSFSQTDTGFQEPKKRKFPLSVREMILIGIALVGIVVVIIMYT